MIRNKKIKPIIDLQKVYSDCKERLKVYELHNCKEKEKIKLQIKDLENRGVNS